ncbi:MAG: efflux RND transporter periplasmic adaptor subunit [Rhodocyclaceae bacterium]|nr:efflux RND transporter periplasmic adaptor subunit [Rhodocyclaceae bacterium]
MSALLAGCSGGGDAAPPAAPPAMPVALLTARPTQLPATVEVTAQTEGSREVEVRARVGGILMKRLYQEGSAVKAGQSLFQIDRAPFEIALAQAKAGLADAKARAEQTGREMARLKGLVAQQAISQKEFDDASSNAAVAQASLQGAEAKVKDAELNLSYTSVTAPVAGMSGRAARSEGTLMSAGADSLLTTIVQLNPLWVRFSLSDSEIARLPGGRVSPGTVKAVELVLADGSSYGTQGHLNFAASAVDPKLGTVALRAEFDNAEGRLLPGQFVRARVIGGNRDGVFLVPQTAIMQSDAGRFVYVVGAGDKAEVRPVTVGEWRGKDWVVLGGLKAGDRIIVDNLIKVRPGSPVTEKKPGGGPAAPGAPAAKP